MNFGDLYHANFALLGTAVEGWDHTISGLTALEHDARTGLKERAERANWSGVNSQVSKAFIRSTAREFSDAVTEATSIRNILRDTRDDLIAQRKELHRLVEEADSYGLVVQGFDDGGYQVAHKSTDGPVDQDTRMAQQDKGEDVSRSIEAVLQAADEIDSSASTALMLLVDQAKYGFSDAKYADRDTAAKALEDADKAAKLARIKEPSDAQLREINQYLAEHKNDDLFADRFASRLGAAGTLQFWTNVTAEHGSPHGEQLKQLQSLQDNLSMTLATASTSDSEGMTRWKQGVIHSGSEVFQPAGSASGPRGYQVMGSLLGKGRYDTEFLNEFSKSVIDFENPGPSAAEVWLSGSEEDLDLDFGKGDGRDPIAGVLQALSHNHEASEEVFSSQDRLDHILDTTEQSTERSLYAGHALHAAVTGSDYSNGLVLPGAPHSDEQVGIMANVMAHYAHPDHSGAASQPPIAASLGSMTSSYMAEINRVIAGSENSDTLYPTGDGHPSDLNKRDTVRFLYDLAQNKDSNAAVLMGSSMYSGGLINMHMDNPDIFGGSTDTAIKAISKNSGIIEGIMGHSRMDMSIENGQAYDASYNDALKQQGDLIKTAVSLGAALGPEFVLGGHPAASAAGGAGLAFVGGIAGIAVDNYVSDHSLDRLDEHIYGSSLNLTDSEDAGRRQLALTSQQAATKSGYEIMPDALSQLVGSDYGDGWLASDSLIEEYHRRPSA